MRTSNPKPRRTTTLVTYHTPDQSKRKAPKPVSLTELALVFCPILTLIIIGAVGAQSWGWSQNATAIFIASSVFGILILWAIVRSALVNAGILHPRQVGRTSEDEQRRRAQQRR